MLYLKALHNNNGQPTEIPEIPPDNREFPHTDSITEPPTTAPAGQFRNVRYVRAEDMPVEERVHGFAAEGFTVTRTEEVNGEYDFRSMNYFIEDTDGQHYMVQLTN